MKFRAKPLNLLSVSDWDILLYQKELFERRWSKKRLFPYKSTKRGGKKLVFDKITDLTWQQSGSPAPVTFGEAKNYIRELNKQRFAKCNDWRFPTLNEAMTLLTPCKDDHNLYVDAEFDATQKWIWTNDESNDEIPWVVAFVAGNYYVPADKRNFVRAVRGEFWVPGDDSVDDEFDSTILAGL